MKKISLSSAFSLICALSAVAAPSVMADTLGDFTFSIDASKVATVTALQDSNNSLTLELGELSIHGENTSGYKFASTTYLCPDVNVGSGSGAGAKYWEQQFTLSNTSDATLTLTSITIAVDGLKSNGQAQNGSNKHLDVIFSADSQTQTWTVDAGSGSSIDSLTYTFETPITLAVDGGLSFSVKAATNANYSSGSYLALSGLQFSGTAEAATEVVPEPATATLSLLALAGLAARRRRK